MNITIKEVNFFLQPGVASPPGRRPWESHIDNHSLEALHSTLADAPRPTAGLLADISGEVLRPASVVEDVFDIANGWGEDRYHVVIEFSERTRGHGMVEHYVITGYTDHSDHLSHMGTLAPETIIYLTGVQSVTQQMHNGHSVMDVHGSQIIQNSQNVRVSDRSTVLNALRPCDVIAATTPRGSAINKARQKLGAVADRGTEVSSPSSAIRYGAGTILGKNNASKFGNVSSGQFLASVANALHAGHTATIKGSAELYDDDQETIENNIAATAISRLKESMQNIPAYQLLESQTSLTATGHITWQDLLDIDHTVEDRATVHRCDFGSMDYDIFSVDPNAATNDHLAAYLLAVNTPVKMVNNTLSVLDMHFTSRTDTGGWRATVVNYAGISDTVIPYGIADRMESIYETEVLPPLTSLFPDGVSSIRMEASIETGMTVCIEDGDPISFPIYASTLYSPTVTSDERRAGKIGQDIRAAFTDIYIDILPRGERGNAAERRRRGESAIISVDARRKEDRARPVDLDYGRGTDSMRKKSETRRDRSDGGRKPRTSKGRSPL